MWESTHTLVNMGKGSVAAKAILLCSLLLGFSLDAYVTMGTVSTSQARAIWVTTISASGRAEFWDPVSGFRTVCDGGDHSYRKVGCLFHHNGFWACVSAEDDVRAIRTWDLADGRVWKALGRDAVLSVRR